MQSWRSQRLRRALSWPCTGVILIAEADMKKYGKFAALIVIIVGTLIWLATATIKDNQTYYKTVVELSQMGDQAYVKRLRVGGDVGAGSIVHKGAAVEFMLVPSRTDGARS